MAWIFSMWIETGEDESAGQAIRDYFDNLSILKTDEKQYKIYTHKQGQGNIITVDRISRSGVTSLNDAMEMTKIGFEFYNLLKSAPKFRYAMVGVEVDEFRNWYELVEEPNDIQLFKGLVIRKDVYRYLGSPGILVEFKDDYLWTLYEGESYLE
jgi:hypothetical protein